MKMLVSTIADLWVAAAMDVDNEEVFEADDTELEAHMRACLIQMLTSLPRIFPLVMGMMVLRACVSHRPRLFQVHVVALTRHLSAARHPHVTWRLSVHNGAALPYNMAPPDNHLTWLYLRVVFRMRSSLILV